MTFKVKTRLKVGSAEAKAEAFALKAHGDQPHGCLKIEDHLRDVVKHVKLHYCEDNWAMLDDVAAAAWLHDSCEDAGITIEDIDREFNGFVADIVELVTDKKGANRYERHLRTYHALRGSPDALLVKLCDRRHNHERSIANGEHWAAMYHSEYLYFKMALYRPHQFVNLWKELDSQYAQMNEMLRFKC